MARAQQQPIRITTAAESRKVDLAQRQKRYMTAMAIRTACFIGAVIAGVNHIQWLWPVLIVAAIFLPYLAVVMANAANTKGQTEMDLLDTPYHANELGGGQDAEPTRPAAHPEDRA